MGLMNNLAHQCYAERERECERVSSCADVLLFWLAVASDVLPTPALSCSGVVNLMHTGQSKHQRERERDKKREE